MNGFIASALSIDTLMGHDSVMACILNSSKEVVNVEMYWNFKGYVKPLTDLQLGNIHVLILLF